MMATPLFIAGAPRSGTTLVRTLVMTLMGYIYHPTNFSSSQDFALDGGPTPPT